MTFSPTDISTKLSHVPRADVSVPVKFQWSKLDGTQHWSHRTVALGEDEFGFWFGQKKGTRSSRPGRANLQGTDVLMLVPIVGQWVAKFFPEGRRGGRQVYVDLATQVRYRADRHLVTAVDMDLDVIKSVTRGVWIEDQDEFMEHEGSMKYPADLVRKVWGDAVAVEKMVREGSGPFGGRAEYWFDVFTKLQEV